MNPRAEGMQLTTRDEHIVFGQGLVNYENRAGVVRVTLADHEAAMYSLRHLSNVGTETSPEFVIPTTDFLAAVQCLQAAQLSFEPTEYASDYQPDEADVARDARDARLLAVAAGLSEGILRQAGIPATEVSPAALPAPATV